VWQIPLSIDNDVETNRYRFIGSTERKSNL